MPKSRNEDIFSSRMSLIIYGADITGMKLMMSYSVQTSFSPLSRLSHGCFILKGIPQYGEGGNFLTEWQNNERGVRFTHTVANFF